MRSLSNYDGDVNENGKKSVDLDKQNNNFAGASRFFVRFSAVVARLQCETFQLNLTFSRERGPKTALSLYIYIYNFNGQSLKLPDECGPTIWDHTKQHCRNKRSMIISYIYICIFLNLHTVLRIQSRKKSQHLTNWIRWNKSDEFWNSAINFLSDVFAAVVVAVA